MLIRVISTDDGRAAAAAGDGEGVDGAVADGAAVLLIGGGGGRAQHWLGQIKVLKLNKS